MQRRGRKEKKSKGSKKMVGREREEVINVKKKGTKERLKKGKKRKIQEVINFI